MFVAATIDLDSTRIRPVVHEVERPQISSPEPIQNSANSNHPRKTNLKKIFIIIFLTAIIVSFVAGGLYVYFSGPKSKSDSLPSPTPTAEATPVPTPSPSPTPEPLPDLTEIKINILNGSGKIGEAGKAGDLLELAGFKSITTGNASRFDYEETIIEAKESVSPKVVSLAKEALAKSYKVSVGNSLKNTSAYDLVITVGSQ